MNYKILLIFGYSIFSFLNLNAQSEKVLLPTTDNNDMVAQSTLVERDVLFKRANILISDLNLRS